MPLIASILTVSFNRSSMENFFRGAGVGSGNSTASAILGT
jgi:hypothetical protein